MADENKQTTNTTTENVTQTQSVPKTEVNPELVKFEEERQKLAADRKSLEEQIAAFQSQKQTTANDEDDFDFDELVLDPYSFFGKKYKLSEDQVIELAQHVFWHKFPDKAPEEFRHKIMDRKINLVGRKTEKKLAKESAAKQRELETKAQQEAEAQAETYRTKLYETFNGHAKSVTDETHPHIVAFFSEEGEDGNAVLDDKALTSALLETATTMIQERGEDAAKLTMDEVKNEIETRLAKRFGRVKPKQAQAVTQTQTKTVDAAPDTVSSRDTSTSLPADSDRFARALEAAKKMFKKE